MTPTSSDIDWPALLALCETMSAPKEEPLTAEGCARRADATMALSTLLSRDYDTIVPVLVALVRGLAQAGTRLRHPMIALTATQVQIAHEERQADEAAWDALLATIPAALRAGVGDGE